MIFHHCCFYSYFYYDHYDYQNYHYCPHYTADIRLRGAEVKGRPLVGYALRTTF